MNLKIFTHVAVLLFATACTMRTSENTVVAEQPQQENLTFSPASLQGEWHMISEQDGEWVLFYPCDADNTFIQVKGDSIIIGWGQDATAGVIEDYTSNETGNEITLAVNDSYAVNYYRVERTENGKIAWWLWEDAERPSQFINAFDKPSYKEVRQPCKECWEDCDEDQQ